MYATLLSAFLTAVGLSQAVSLVDNALVSRDGPMCEQHIPLSPRVRCGEVGTLAAPTPSDSGDYYIPFQYKACTNMNQCVEKCKGVGYQNCKSIGFDKASNQCTFYNSTISKQEFRPSASSSTTFYDAPCFLCPKCAANPIKSTGWEDGTSPWIIEYPALTQIVKGYKSKHAIAFTTIANANFYHGVQQYFYQCGNSNYNLEFDYKYPSGGNGTVGLFVSYRGNQQKYGSAIFSQQTTAEPAGVWYHASVSFSSDSSTGANIDIFFGGVDSDPLTIFVDNIVMSLAPSGEN